jgi:hypothetical protein
MKKKTLESYKAVFKFLKDTYQLRIKTAMTDFEMALRKALKAVFHGVIVYGCYFHYTQVIFLSKNFYLNWSTRCKTMAICGYSISIFWLN